MTASSPDVHQTLEYRATTTVVRLLPTGLFLIFAGLFIYALVDLDREPWTIIGIVLCLVCGIGVAGFALWRRTHHGKPVFTLSPAGIHYRIPFVKSFLIPWSEIRGVDTIDVQAGYWSFSWAFARDLWMPRYIPFVLPKVTVILVSKQFYDARIFIDSFFLRGPAWNANFIPKGDLVQMALHHEYVCVAPQELRAAVEARW